MLSEKRWLLVGILLAAVPCAQADTAVHQWFAGSKHQGSVNTLGFNWHCGHGVCVLRGAYGTGLNMDVCQALVRQIGVISYYRNDAGQAWVANKKPQMLEQCNGVTSGSPAQKADAENTKNRSVNKVAVKDGNIIAQATNGMMTATSGKFYDPDAEQNMEYGAEVVDLNRDGMPEVFTHIYGTYWGGVAGVYLSLYIKDKASGRWVGQFGFPGGYELLKTGNGGYPDITITGPGFCFPVWRWNGRQYALFKKCPS